jgi:photosystem II stability/assembly factor-like uncharacterized protein
MNLKYLIPIFILSIFLASCSLPFSSSVGQVGGVFISSDYGENWTAQKPEKNKIDISSVDTKEIVFDESDHSLVYLATRGNGLFVSENSGADWQQIFKTGFVSSVAVDYESRGVLYIAVENKIYKTIDMGKNWRAIYLENRPEVQITQIAIDNKNKEHLIMGTINGEIYQSKDAGESWKRVFETENNIRKILINKNNSKIVYIATISGGIFRSADGGETWKNLKEKYKDIDSSLLQYRFLAFDPGVSDGLFFVSNFGIIKTSDGGETWTKLKLLTPENSSIINVLAVNQKNNKQIYYATNSVIYRSFDGGATWLSTKNPTTRAVAFMIINPDSENMLYLGVASVNSKPFFFL